MAAGPSSFIFMLNSLAGVPSLLEKIEQLPGFWMRARSSVGYIQTAASTKSISDDLLLRIQLKKLAVLTSSG